MLELEDVISVEASAGGQGQLRLAMYHSAYSAWRVLLVQMLLMPLKAQDTHVDKRSPEAVSNVLAQVFLEIVRCCSRSFLAGVKTAQVVLSRLDLQGFGNEVS